MHTATILAGGRGRRLGGVSKALLSVGERRIIDRQLTTLRSVVDHVAIVADDHTQYADFGVPVWADTVPGAGPLGGILTALLNATTSQVLVVAGDMPFLNTRVLTHLLEAGRRVDVAIPRTADGLHPLCASWGSDCISPIQRQIEAGMLKVLEILPKLNVHEVTSQELLALDPEHTALFNVNTPADYARARALAERHDAHT
jgi:molybdopterin-guanine dinucleotide biosynthesis protein A